MKPGDVLNVELVLGEPGEGVELGNVLLVAGENGMQTGADVGNAVVRATVLGQVKGPKLTIFRYKPKIRYRRKTGHRQNYTRVKIEEIVV